MSREFDRRAILGMIAAGAAASVAGCSRPKERIYPAVNLPDGIAPGEVTRYATTMPLGGYGRGVTGLVVDSRPVKLEGLAAHPASLGATDVFAEMSILDLYDPQRLESPASAAGPGSWETLARAIYERVAPRQELIEMVGDGVRSDEPWTRLDGRDVLGCHDLSDAGGRPPQRYTGDG